MTRNPKYDVSRTDEEGDDEFKGKFDHFAKQIHYYLHHLHPCPSSSTDIGYIGLSKGRVYTCQHLYLCVCPPLPQASQILRSRGIESFPVDEGETHS